MADELQHEIEDQLNEAERALRFWAIPTMQRQMASDDATDAPFNEDMAQTIAVCYRAIGDEDAANKWYIGDVHA
jgi:hypothetical protein